MLSSEENSSDWSTQSSSYLWLVKMTDKEEDKYIKIDDV